MTRSGQHRQEARLWHRDALAAYQLERLNALLAEILPQNRFYARKLGERERLDSLDELTKLPFTTKEELLPGDAHGSSAGTAEPGGSAVSAERGDLAAPAEKDLAPAPAGFGAENRTYPLEKYVRFHQTSGTRGEPLAVFDTAEDWQWWIDCWQYVLDAAGLEAGERALMASSFGPFIAWWSAQDALAARGVMPLPAGGLSSLARIHLMRRAAATALFCTPTYALRLAEVAQESETDLRKLAIRRVVVAGEPGGSIPAVRARIEAAFSATVYDHAGATEVGPWGFADDQRTGVHVTETEFIAEFLSVEDDQPARPGELAELVLTSLGRKGAPVIRYRTGDLVRPQWPADGPCRFVLLDGGVLARADDMMIIRGVNVFPTSVEAILRGFSDVQEYRLTARRRGETDVLEVEVEDRQEEPVRIAREMQLRLGLKVDVRCVPLGSLPRFEAKARRFVDERLTA